MTWLYGVLGWSVRLLGFIVLLIVVIVVDAVTLRMVPMTSLVEIRLAPDESVPLVLGADTLVQSPDGPVSPRHLALIRDGDSVVAYDVSPTRLVGLYTVSNQYSDTAGMVIPQGDSIVHVDGQVISIHRDGDTLGFLSLDSAHSVRLTPEEVELTHQGLPPVSASIGWMAWGRRSILGDFSITYRLGGEAARTRLAAALDRRSIPDTSLPPNALRLVYVQDPGWFARSGEWYLSQGSRSVFLENQQQIVNPEARRVTLLDASMVVQVPRIILGRTTYSVEAGNHPGQITLRPMARNGRIADAQVVPVSDSRILSRAVQTDTLLHREDLLAIALPSLLIALALCWLFSSRGGAQQCATAVALAGFVLAASHQVDLQGPYVLFGELAIAFGAGCLGGFLVAATAISRPHWFSGWLNSAIAALLLIAATALVFVMPQIQRTGPETSIIGLGLTLAAPLIAARMPPAAMVFWALLVGVIGLGISSGLTLAALEPTAAYDEKLWKHVTTLAGVGLLVALALDLRDSWLAGLLRRLLLPGRIARRWLARFVFGLTFIAATVFLSMVFFGDETGLMGVFQPSEFAKTLLVLVVAMALIGDLARREMLSAAEGGQSLKEPIIAFIFVAAIFGTSVLNYDMSPILVSLASTVLVFVLGVVLHVGALRRRGGQRRFGGLPVIPPARFSGPRDPGLFLVRTRRQIARYGSLWPLVFLFLLLVFFSGCAWYLIEMLPDFNLDSDVTFPGSMLTPWLRFASWFDMSLGNSDPFIFFPESGTQLLRGREAIMTFGCSDMLASLCSEAVLPANPTLAIERLLSVPEVEDDFAGVALIYALGFNGALLYAAFQFALVLVAGVIGGSALWARGPSRIWGWILGCVVLGLAAVYFMQIGMAWGNVLGFTPIMGQPMTFVALGASHDLGFALPFALSTVLASCVGYDSLISGSSKRREFFRRRLS